MMDDYETDTMCSDVTTPDNVTISGYEYTADGNETDTVCSDVTAAANGTIRECTRTDYRDKKVVRLEPSLRIV